MSGDVVIPNAFKVASRDVVTLNASDDHRGISIELSVSMPLIIVSGVGFNSDALSFRREFLLNFFFQYL